MNLVDLFILAPILLFALFGLRNGLIREVFLIVGVILSVFVAFRFMENLASIFLPYTEQSPDTIIIFAGFFLFLVTFIGIMILAYLFRRMLEIIQLNLINRLLGMLFGGLKGAVIVSAVLLLFAGIDRPDEEAREESILYSYVVPVAPAAYNAVAAVWPESEKFIENIRSTLDENNPLQELTSIINQ